MGQPAEKYSDEDRLIHASSLAWLTFRPIYVQSGRFSMINHEYQMDWFDCDHPKQCFRKGAQIGATDVQVIKTIHGMMTGRYNQGVMYLFPTSDDVTDFSKARFNPLIERNPEEIGRHITSTDAANIKRIGNGMLYLRGARPTKKIQGKKSSSKLKTAPVDKVVRDEKDEMELAMVRLSKERTSHSTLHGGSGEQVDLSTPTVPDYGIDKDYQNSDQRIWVIKCGKCGKYTCQELEFPTHLHRVPVGSYRGRVYKEASVIRLCSKCRDQEIYPKNGMWIAQYPSVTDSVGWWISQLNSVFKNPKTILDNFENPKDNEDLAETYNSGLGMAWLPTENRLTEQQVLACCGNEPQAGSDSGPCAMGVDVGKTMHVVIGRAPFSTGRTILKVARLTNINDVMDLAKRFNVKMAVFDALPETRLVMDFRKAANFDVYGCFYVHSQKGQAAWNEREGFVNVNPVEICDATHNMITTYGRCTLPRQDAEIREQYAPQMTQMAKILFEDDEVPGKKYYKYIKLSKNDHYRHASNYYELACTKLEPDHVVVSPTVPVTPYKYD